MDTALIRLIYLVYNFAKMVAFASVMLAFGVSQYDKINGYYESVSVCQHCLNAAIADPGNYYEFSFCAG
jgi:hypothetical protein